MNSIPITWFYEVDTFWRIRNCFRCLRIHRRQIPGNFGTLRCRNSEGKAPGSARFRPVGFNGRCIQLCVLGRWWKRLYTDCKDQRRRGCSVGTGSGREGTDPGRRSAGQLDRRRWAPEPVVPKRFRSEHSGLILGWKSRRSAGRQHRRTNWIFPALLPGVISLQGTNGRGDGHRQRSSTSFCKILFKN